MPTGAQADPGCDPNGRGVASPRLAAGDQVRGSPGGGCPGHVGAPHVPDLEGITRGGALNPPARPAPHKLRPAAGVLVGACDVRPTVKSLTRAILRGLGTAARRATDEPFDIERFIDVLGIEKLSDTLNPGHEQIAPGAGALRTTLGSIFHLMRPAPHTHILLRVEDRFRATAEEFALRYVVSDKQAIAPTAHLHAGIVLASLGRHVEALEAYVLAGGANPCGLVLCFMAISAASLNRLEEACRACRESLRLMPDLDMTVIALRTYERALKNPGRLQEPRPLVILLSMADEPTCCTCGRQTRDHGHIGLEVSAVESFGHGLLHSTGMTLLRLCYVRGLCDIAVFRRTKIVMCMYSALELGMLFVEPVTAMQLGSIRPLVEIAVCSIGGTRSALPCGLGGGKENENGFRNVRHAWLPPAPLNGARLPRAP